MSLKNLSLGRKLIFGFGAIICLLLAVDGVAVFLGSRTFDAVSSMSRLGEINGGMKDILLQVRAGRALAWNYFATGEEQLLKDANVAFDDVERRKNNILAIVKMPNGAVAIEKFAADVAKFRSVVTSLAVLKAKKVDLDTPEAKALVQDVQRLAKVYAASNEEAVKISAESESWAEF